MSPARDGAVAAALLLPVVAGALFSLVRLSAEAADVPTDAEYAALAARLQTEGFDPATDGLVVLPPWSLRPHVHLKGFAPIGGDAIGERPLHRYARLFALVEPDAESHLQPLLARASPPALDTAFGPVRLLRFDNAGPRATFDLRERLGDATVRIMRGESEVVACDKWSGSKWSCPGRKGWQRVEAAWQLVSENGQRVIWSHPPSKGETLEVTFDNAPIGDGVVLRAGHTRDGAAGAQGNVDVELRIDGEVIERLAVPPRFDFKSHTIDTAARRGTTGTLTLAISSDTPGRQHFAWDAWVFAKDAP